MASDGLECAARRVWKKIETTAIPVNIPTTLIVFQAHFPGEFLIDVFHIAGKVVVLDQMIPIMSMNALSVASEESPCRHFFGSEPVDIHSLKS